MAKTKKKRKYNKYRERILRQVRNIEKSTGIQINRKDVMEAIGRKRPQHANAARGLVKSYLLDKIMNEEKLTGSELYYLLLEGSYDKVTRIGSDDPEFELFNLNNGNDYYVNPDGHTLQEWIDNIQSNSKAADNLKLLIKEIMRNKLFPKKR